MYSGSSTEKPEVNTCSRFFGNLTFDCGYTSGNYKKKCIRYLK